MVGGRCAGYDKKIFTDGCDRFIPKKFLSPVDILMSPVEFYFFLSE